MNQVCKKCRRELPAAEFYRRASGQLRRICKACMCDANAANYRANVAARKEQHEARYLNQRETILARHRSNYERKKPEYAERGKRWRQENNGAANAYTRAYRLRKREQMPAWADPSTVALAYVYGAAWSSATRVAHHVDHIVPLNSRAGVTGLHCEANLKIIPATLNLSKQDRYWPHEVAFPNAFSTVDA